MLKQKLSQKLLQKLSPQQIQMIKLLEIPTLQLEQRIKKELEENPVLEEGAEEKDTGEQEGLEEEIGKDNEQDQDKDEFSLEDRLSARNYSKDERKEEIPFSGGVSFHENLEAQLGLRNLTEEQEMLAHYILGNIDEDGYLRRKLNAIVDDLAFSMNITTSEDDLHEILKVIQDFDPVAGMPFVADRVTEPG